MLKKTFKFVDYNGNPRTEDHYFNLTQAEVTELELSVDGGLTAMINRVVQAQNGRQIIDTMKDSLNVQNIQITDQPKLSFEPVGPSIRKNAAVGGLGGLALGLGFLLIRMLTDKRLKTREEAEKYLGLPVYAELPDLEK